MRIFTLISFMLLAAASAIAQPTINFEVGGSGAGYTWNVFENGSNPPLEIVANPNASGINTSAKVAKFTAKQDGPGVAPYAGTETVHGAFGTFTLSASNSTVKIMVYKPVISNVGIKFAINNGGALQELKVANTKINEWEELTFDFSGKVGLPETINIDQIIVFPDFAARANDNICYFDNITFSPQGGGGGVATAPTVAAPTPTRDATKVISMFSNAYTNVPVNTWRTDWSAATLTDLQVAGNDTKKYSGLDFVGVEAVGANSINATSMLYFHVDAWTPNITSLRIKLVDFGADGAFAGGDDKEHELTFTPKLGEWNGYDIPLTDFAGLTTKAHISQIIFAGAPVGSSTLFIDNVYFHSVSGANPPPTEPTVAAPTPTRDATKVISMFSNAYTNVPVNTWRTDWSAATLTDLQVAGNDTKKYSGLDFVGVEAVGANSINATTMEFFHVDIWTPNMTTFRIKLVDFGADGAFAGGDDKEHELTFTPTLSGWNSYDLNLNDFVGLTTKAHISQLIFSGVPVGSGILYVDNVYFYTTKSKTDQTITFPAITDKTIGDAAFNLSATASSGLTVAYSTVSDKVTINASSVTIVKAGRVVIKANQAGNASFNAAPEVTQSFCIKPAKPTITTSGLNTETVTLTSSSTTGNQWYLNGNAIANATNSTFTPTGPGTYKVQVKVDDCASAFSNDTPLVVTGDLSSHASVAVFPNPTDLYIEVSGIKGEVSESKMIDVTGRGNAIHFERSGEVLRADVGHLSTGVYVLQIQEGNTIHKLKVIKN